MRQNAVGYRDAAPVIFEGRVEKQEVEPGSPRPPERVFSMTTSGKHLAVTMRVSRVYRGPKQPKFVVVTGMGTGDCGYVFATGEEYLVFATPAEGGRVFTNICSGTQLLEHSAPALRLLRDEPAAPEDLLDEVTHYKTFFPRWTGRLCGRVTRPDGKPLADAEIAMSEVREPGLQLILARFPIQSKSDGTFCVEQLLRGRYLLTAELRDDKKEARWRGFYPGVMKYAEATPINVKAGDDLSDFNFTVQEERLYSIRSQIVTSDGRPLPWQNLGVYVTVLEPDALAYDLHLKVDEDASLTFRSVPAGRYIVGTYLTAERRDVPKAVTRWGMAKQEVDITGDTNIVLVVTAPGWSLDSIRIAFAAIIAIALAAIVLVRRKRRTDSARHRNGASLVVKSASHHFALFLRALREAAHTQRPLPPRIHKAAFWVGEKHVIAIVASVYAYLSAIERGLDGQV